MAWNDFLLPASWRGVPFGVETAEIEPGRQVAEHSYPYRETDPIWAEDTGAKRRPFTFQGFLVEGDIFAAGLGVFLQRDLMVAACNQKGTGTLIHPSLGIRTVQLLGCKMTENVENGGVIELNFTFVESATGPKYPTSASDTQAASTTAAASTDSASASSLGSSISSAVQSGADAVGQAVSTVGGFVDQAVDVVGTATRYAGSVAGLAGVVGRFSSGNRAVLQNPAATASSLLAAATVARTGVSVAADGAKSLASAL